MSKASGNGETAPMSMFETITARLAAITPEMYIAPTDRPDRRRHVIVGTASEHVKKLWTLHEQLGQDAKPLIFEGELLMEQVKLLLGETTRGPEELLALVRTIRQSDDIMATAERLAEIALVARPLHRLQKFVQRLLWNEVRSCATALEDKERLFVGADWEVGYQSQSTRGDDTLAGLMQMLAQRGDVQVQRL